ncbi:unnamed protein product [Vitrella brassicaformis CCMP3155]|uniref:Uncharacterized protein n=2 Tax=Vitrella brassicaformis TaxID=1169539 RepID=A0A0G4H5Y3_VITBC|nr:unnamed protein product [Vitrella brassicaformis CCMP3155]|eukprot:CEM38992.1 unnamed protein product [Vitrella brassicaformis CCMP3155]
MLPANPQSRKRKRYSLNTGKLHKKARVRVAHHGLRGVGQKKGFHFSDQQPCIVCFQKAAKSRAAHEVRRYGGIVKGLFPRRARRKLHPRSRSTAGGCVCVSDGWIIRGTA